MTELKKYLVPNLDDTNAYRYLYGSKEFVPGKSYVYYSGPYWDEKEITSILDSVCYGKWLSTGEKVHKFEISFSKKFNHSKSLMVNSGSSANLVLIAALKECFGWKDNDEVIISSVGFSTTLNAIIQNGLKPVFVDISFEDLNWNIDEIEKKITNKTVAVFSSPVLGNPYDFDKLHNICKANNIVVIGDNCDSLGSKWNGMFLTDFYEASSCSFYPSHHISCGEGGMVSSKNEHIVDLARSYAWWGRGCWCVGAANLLPQGTCGTRFDPWLKDSGYEDVVDHKYVFSKIGYNLKPLDLQGAIGQQQLLKFEDIVEKRRINKHKMDEVISKIDGIRTINELEKGYASWFGTPFICETKELKNKLVSYLEENKIQTRNYFAGNYMLHPAYSKFGKATDYPNAMQVLDKVFFIGCAPFYNDTVFEYVSSVIDKFL